jgi:hypothetical protein
MSERLLDIIEQWFWGILGLLLAAFSFISYITGDMRIVAICMIVMIAVLIIRFIVFELIEKKFEDRFEDEDEGL